MSDLELLELAAKAAGLPLKFGGDWHNVGVPHVDNKSWDPLANDGDAFRLMVDLNLDLTVDVIEGEVFACETFGDYWSEYLRDNPHAATRRAIVRAAAAIGESL